MWRCASRLSVLAVVLVLDPCSVRANDGREFVLFWSGGACRASNPVHGFSARFTDSSVRIEVGSEWLDLRLAGEGFDPRLDVELPRIAVALDRLDYVRDMGLAESYVNTSRGLEQQLRLDIASEAAFRLSGSLAPRVSVNGQVVELVAAGGDVALHIAGLRAQDGTGEELPARFELDPEGGLLRIRVRVEPGRAPYPLEVKALFTSPSAAPTATSHLVISEIQVDGNGADPARDEFIEIYNPTGSPVSLAGWSLQALRNSNFSQDNIASGSVPAYGYFLAARAEYNGPTPRDFTLSNMSPMQNGTTVFLVSNQTTLSGCPSAGTVVDKVGWNTSCAEGNDALVPPSNGSIERKPGSLSPLCGNFFDSDDNSADFVVRSVSEPQNTSSTPEAPCSGVSVDKSDSADPVAVGATLAYTVTASSLENPALNVTVEDTLPGGVTFIQTSGCDNDPAGVPSCMLGTIAAGDSRAYTVTVSVDECPAGELSNSVTVSATNDGTPSDNTDVEVTAVGACDDGDVCTAYDACSGGACTGTFMDTDADEICDALDCAPLDPTNSAPAVVSSIALAPTPSGTEISWSAVSGAVEYAIYRGTVTGGWTYSHACLEVSPDTSVIDGTVPDPGSLLYYLVAARNPCGDSGLGAGAFGDRPAPPCP